MQLQITISMEKDELESVINADNQKCFIQKKDKTKTAKEITLNMSAVSDINNF